MSYISIAQTRGKIYHKFIDSSGKRTARIEYFRPRVWKENQHGFWKSYITNKLLKEERFDNCYDFMRYRRDNRDSTEKYGWIDPEYQFLYEHYIEQRKELNAEIVIQNARYFYFDIEVLVDPGDTPDPLTNDAKYPISTIAVYDSYFGERYVFGYKDYNGNGDFRYVKCNDEIHLLKCFLHLWTSGDYPDMVIGWNSTKFDIPYLCHRLNKLDPNLMNELSPISYVSSRVRKGGEDNFFKDYMTYEIHGVKCVDLQAIYKKFVVDPVYSYSLETISEVELDQHKVHYEGTLNVLYEEDFDTYVEYNMQDVDLMVSINNKKKLIDLIIDLCYECKIQFDLATTPTQWWNYKMSFDYLLPNHFVPNLYNANNHGGEFEGAEVYDTIVGLHEWVVGVDAEAMYPTGIRCQNIGPETLIEGEPEEGVEYTTSPSGIKFRKDKQSFFSQSICELIDKRRGYKKVKFESEKELELLNASGSD